MCYSFGMAERQTKIVPYTIRIPEDLKTRIINYGKRNGHTGNGIGLVLLRDAINQAESAERGQRDDR